MANQSKALQVPTVTEAQLRHQVALFEAARDVHRMRKEVRERTTRESKYLTILKANLAEAEARYQTLSGEAIAQAVAS